MDGHGYEDEYRDEYESRTQLGSAVGVFGFTGHASGTATPRTTEPRFTSTGYRIMETFVIHKSEAIDGAIHFELLKDGNSCVWAGPEEEWKDGLLDVIMKIADEEPEIPDH
jgi:hypothetical protein